MLRKFSNDLATRMGVAPEQLQQRQQQQPSQTPQQQTMVTYEGEKAMRKGVAQMQRKGWSVQNTTTYQPRAGLGRMVALGIFAAVFKPKVKFVVTFTR